ncbi:unnamed protein product, partial [Meganyctiphanes norvegica]
TDRFSGPYENVWNSGQCEYIVWYHGESLLQCKSVCLEWSTCTALNYEDGPNTVCVLWACQLPAPSPKSTRSSYKGYSLIPDRFSGPYENVWSIEQCEYIVWYHGKSLSQCKSVCLELSTCTDFNYKDGPITECVLWACPCPAPSPKLTRSSYKGYSLILGMCSVDKPIASSFT